MQRVDTAILVENSMIFPHFVSKMLLISPQYPRFYIAISYNLPLLQIDVAVRTALALVLPFNSVRVKTHRTTPYEWKVGK